MNPNLANVARIDEFISKSISLQACFMGADIFVGNSTPRCKISEKKHLFYHFSQNLITSVYT